MSERIQLWSSGGGVQSTAIAVLILQGKLPKPDLAVIADTEREKETTWQYFDAYTKPALESFGVTIHRIKKSDWGAPDLLSAGSIIMPMFTRATADGEVGKLPAYCSNEWKQRVVRRWANAHTDFGNGRTASFRVWMGMSFDEPRRVRPTIGKWENWYPLFEMGIRRGECIHIVRDYGWPDPPQSSCWMCPNRRPDQWPEMDWAELEKAAKLELELQLIDPDVYLHPAGKPLFRAMGETEKSQQLAIWDTERCDSGYCFV